MSSTPRRSALTLLWVIALVMLGVDQITKAIAVAVLAGQPRIPVLGEFVGFVFLRNPGAAFGLGASTTWLFAIIAFVVFGVVIYLSRSLHSRAWGVGLGLLLGGLTGNLYDRLFRPPASGGEIVFMHGAVVDFIDMYFFVCNVADIAISAAAVLIAWLTLKGIGLDGFTDEQRGNQKAESERLAQ